MSRQYRNALFQFCQLLAVNSAHLTAITYMKTTQLPWLLPMDVCWQLLQFHFNLEQLQSQKNKKTKKKLIKKTIIYILACWLQVTWIKMRVKCDIIRSFPETKLYTLPVLFVRRSIPHIYECLEVVELLFLNWFGTPMVKCSGIELHQSIKISISNGDCVITYVPIILRHSINITCVQWRLNAPFFWKFKLSLFVF